MTTFVLILMLNTWSGDGKGALEKVDGFTSKAACEEAGRVFENTAWAQYYYCVEVK